MKDKRIYHLFVFYFLANVYMLINNGIFWDDWTIIKMEKTGLLQQFGENGLWILIYFHDALNDSSYSPILYHWLSFIFLFGAYVCFYKILKQFKFSEVSAFALSLIAMLLPYFETKNTVVCMPYAMFLFSFALGLYLIFKFLDDRSKLINLLTGIILLFFGFFLNSLLLTFLFVLGLYFLSKNDFSLTKIKENSLKTILVYIGLIALPFLFWFVKKSFFAIKGLYASRGYNVINFNFKKLPDQYSAIVENNIGGLYKEFIAVFENDITFGILIFVISIVISVYVLKNQSMDTVSRKRLLLVFIVGVILFFIGTYPYTVVNKLPVYTGFRTRHQVLLPIGVSFLFYAIIFAFPRYIRKGVFIFFIAVFITTTSNLNVNFLRGWIKTEAVKNEMNQLTIDTKGVVFTKGFNGKFNATERPFTFYEVNGISKEASNRQDLFLIPEKDYTKMAKKSLPGILSHAVKFNMKDITDTVNQESLLEITYKKDRISHLEVLKYTSLYFFDRDNYKNKVKELISIEYVNDRNK